MAKQFAALFVALALLSGVVGHTAIAQGVNPFSKRGGLNFTAADFDLLNQSRDELLAAQDGDPVRRWRNPNSGSGGVTTLVQTVPIRLTPTPTSYG